MPVHGAVYHLSPHETSAGQARWREVTAASPFFRDDRDRLAWLDSFWPDHHSQMQVKDRLYDALRSEQSRITVVGDRLNVFWQYGYCACPQRRLR